MDNFHADVETNMGIEGLDVINFKVDGGNGKELILGSKIASTGPNITDANLVEIPIGLVLSQNNVARPIHQWKRVAGRGNKDKHKLLTVGNSMCNR